MRALVLKKVWVDMDKEAIRRIAKAEEEGLCLACLEKLKPGEAVIRGDHARCYHAIYRAIQRGETTDAQMVAKGMMLEASRGGRPRSNPISIELKLA
ncbi:MAG: hypothetical protein AAF394_04960 [Planctomycetota bacterium]